MVQGGSGLRFLEQALLGVGVFRARIGEELERDCALQPAVVRPVHDSHTAATQLFDQFVV